MNCSFLWYVARVQVRWIFISPFFLEDQTEKNPRFDNKFFFRIFQMSCACIFNVIISLIRERASACVCMCAMNNTWFSYYALTSFSLSRSVFFFVEQRDANSKSGWNVFFSFHFYREKNGQIKRSEHTSEKNMKNL